MSPNPDRETQVCIVGGGPAGILLGYLLARSGVEVIVMEKHADFFRDFRGDTVHPSTLEILDECGLMEKFDALPQHRVEHLSARFGESAYSIIDFRGLKPFGFLALVPQWDLLNLLAEEAKTFPGFDLRMRHEVTGAIREDGKVAGVTVSGPEGDFEIRAKLVVGCDGRTSTVRGSIGLPVRDLGAPMDALWFKLPRLEGDPEETQAIFGVGRIMILLNRNDYWQAAFVVSKGGDAELRTRPIEYFRGLITDQVPIFKEHTAALASWDAVKTLVVKVDRLERWSAPGVLLIGDAAHAMSPVGGVGINLAVQDAVAAANILAPALREGLPIDEGLLKRVQSRREFPTKIIQRLQLTIQKRVISKALTSDNQPKLPALMAWLIRFRWVRNIPARIIGYGFRREHVTLDFESLRKRSQD